jgi:hypothetical protein
MDERETAIRVLIHSTTPLYGFVRVDRSAAKPVALKNRLEMAAPFRW